MRSELDRVRADNANTERELRAQIADIRSNLSGTEWQQRYHELEKELGEQQQVTEEVRREASQFLKEMRILSEQSEQAMEQEEKLQQQLSQLELELKDWKSRYARAKTQLRSIKTTSIGLGLQSPDVSNYSRDPSFTQPDGLVKDVHFTKFQLAVDELLQVARKSDADATMASMKHVVLCVRQITADVDVADSQRSSIANGDLSDEAKAHAKIKSRVSATANNLITASKNHASANGLSPVSLLDAAASHLSTAVVELIRIVKLRPTPPGELEDDEQDIANRQRPASRGYLSLTNGYGHMRNRSKGGSDSTTFSTDSPRREQWRARSSDVAGPVLVNGASGLREQGLYEFKSYLDDQTAVLVQNIQPLVHSIRSHPTTMPLSPTDETAIINYISEISRTVQDTTSKTTEAMRDLGNNALACHAPPVVGVLDRCREELLDAEQHRDRVPPVAFRIARAMKVSSSAMAFRLSSY
jgi:predicted DNA binding CopG/RHH family protein